MWFNNTAIFNIFSVDNCCIINGIRKSDFINLSNVDLRKSGALWNIKTLFIMNKKMNNEIITVNDIEIEKSKLHHRKN